MGVSKRLFGTTSSGLEVYSYTLYNQHQCSVEILSFGAIIHSILIPDRHGNQADVVTGLQTVKEYESNPAYFGAIIGRVTNRLNGSHLKVKGHEIKVNCNQWDVCQHGGVSGFDKKLWDHQSGSSDIGQWVELTYLSKHGEEGFPGNLSVKAVYTLENNSNNLCLTLTSKTDLPTLVNLTNHAYFNLAGHKHVSIKDHSLTVNASHYLPLNHLYLPTGEVRSVEATPFCLANGRKVGQVIEEIVDEVGIKGIDHNFCINGYQENKDVICQTDVGCQGDETLRTAVVLKDENSGRTLTLQTNQPGIQVYTGNHLDGSIVGKHSSTYPPHSCIALEAQKWPDAPNHKHFPSILLEPGQQYKHLTVYKFSTD